MNAAAQQSIEVRRGRRRPRAPGLLLRTLLALRGRSWWRSLFFVGGTLAIKGRLRGLALLAFGAGASSDDDSPSKGGAGRAFFAGGGFGGRASSDESLSKMDLAFFFFAEAGARRRGRGAGAAAPAALRRRASAAARRFSSRRRLSSAPLRPFTTFGFSARSDSAVTIVLPLVKAAPKLCLGFGFGFAMGLGGGRALVFGGGGEDHLCASAEI